MQLTGRRYGSYYLAALISCITFAVYLPSLLNDFVNWDDYYYIHNNIHLRSLNRAFLQWAFTEFYESNWHPLTWISHALDYAIWGLNPLGHHLTNIFLHAVNTFFVVLLTGGLMKMRKERSRNPNTPPRELSDGREIMIVAGVTGLLFGLHPLHVESVAWISERKDLLCGLFFLLSTMAFTRYVRDSGCSLKQDAPSGYFNKFFLLSLAFFVCALLSKPMAVSLPIVLLILDWYPFRRADSLKSFRTAVTEKLPFISFSLIAGLLTILAQRDAMWSVSPPLSIRMLAAATSLISYLRKMIVPLDLVPFYPYKQNSFSYFSLEAIAAVIVVFGITILSIKNIKKEKAWAAAWTYYVVTLIPVLGIIQVGSQSMADRYTYLPSLGPFMVAGGSAAWLWKKTASLKHRERAARWTVIAATTCLVAAMSYAVFRQVAVWKNSVDLWSYVIEKEPYRVPLAYHYRGLAFEGLGLTDRAMEDFNTALSLNANYADAYWSRGLAYKKKGQLDRAIDDFNRAIRLHPDDVAVYIDLGLTLKEMGRPERAADVFTAAIARKPTYADAYIQRGLVFKETGRFKLAVADYDKAISLNESSAETYNNRGVTYKYLGRFDLALSDYDKAIALNPSFYLAYMNRGMVYAMLGQESRAINDYAMTLSLNPEFAAAHLSLGNLYARRGNNEMAIAAFQKACDLKSEEGCRSLQVLKGR